MTAIYEKTATATLRRIGVSRRIQILGDGRFFGEFRESTDGRWRCRVWLPSSHEGHGRGMPIGEASLERERLTDVIEAAQDFIAPHIDRRVRIDPHVEADFYYGRETLANYPHLASDWYLAAARYSIAEGAVRPILGGGVLVTVGPPMLCGEEFAKPCEVWRNSGSDDPGYLAYLASEHLRRTHRGITSRWVKSFVR